MTHQLVLAGVPVKFPFEPYECQVKYMEKLIRTLNAATNCILESPTGTGKTMSLLCSTLGWREHKRKQNLCSGTFPNETNEETWMATTVKGVQNGVGGDRLPQIIYASRTHGQLTQVVKELKRSGYKPRVTVVGSRQHMCVNPEVLHLHGTARNNYCKELVKARQCDYYSGLDENVKKKSTEHIQDIEDLVTKAKQQKFCPYYLMQDESVQNNADIVFMPYNYLVNPGTRAALKIDFTNAIVIFDEAHNLDGICRDAASFDLTPQLIAGCITEVDRLMNHARSSRAGHNTNAQQDFDSTDPLERLGSQISQLAMVKAILLDFEEEVQKFPFAAVKNGVSGQAQSFTASGDEIFKLLHRVGITRQNATTLINYLGDELLPALQEWRPAAAAKPLNLEVFRDCIGLLFAKNPGSLDNELEFGRFFRVHVHAQQDSRDDNQGSNKSGTRSGFQGFQMSKKSNRTISVWCMHPGIALQHIKLLGVRSIVLTSGTLSPISALVSEFAPIKFPFRLENNHVVKTSHVRVLVLERGVTNKILDGSYSKRSDPVYLKEMGNTLCYFCRTVPDGLLVFFSSYTMMGQFLAFWKSYDGGAIWKRIEQHKETFIEPRQSTLFPETVEGYEKSLSQRIGCGGAVFFAVCRGKASEGIDFSDFKCRAVMAIGIPFPNVGAPKIQTKRSFMDALKRERSEIVKSLGTVNSAETMRRKQQLDSMLSGGQWYNIQASRAVNQAIGRVIRHINDWGAIILCDRRFSSKNQRAMLSKWLDPYWHVSVKFADAARTLAKFYKQFPKRQSKAVVDVEVSRKPLRIAYELQRPRRLCLPSKRANLSTELARHSFVDASNNCENKSLNQKDSSKAEASSSSPSESFASIWMRSSQSENNSRSSQDQARDSTLKQQKEFQPSTQVKRQQTSGFHCVTKSPITQIQDTSVDSSMSQSSLHMHIKRAKRPATNTSESCSITDSSPRRVQKQGSDSVDNAVGSLSSKRHKVKKSKSQKVVMKANYPAGVSIFQQVKATMGRKHLKSFKKIVLQLRGKKTAKDWRIVLDALAELFSNAEPETAQKLMSRFSTFVPQEFRHFTSEYSFPP